MSLDSLELTLKILGLITAVMVATATFIKTFQEIRSNSKERSERHRLEVQKLALEIERLSRELGGTKEGPVPAQETVRSTADRSPPKVLDKPKKRTPLLSRLAYLMVAAGFSVLTLIFCVATIVVFLDKSPEPTGGAAVMGFFLAVVSGAISSYSYDRFLGK